MPTKLPLAVTGMILVALTALVWVKGGSPLLIGFGVAIVAAYVIPARVGGESAGWLLRLGLFLAASGATLLVQTQDQEGLLDPRLVHLVGNLCAAELVAQAWRTAQSRAALLILPGFIFLAAGDNFDAAKMHLFAPAFLLCLMLATPGYRTRSDGRFTWVTAVRLLAVPVLAHRLSLDTKARYGGVLAQHIIEEALASVPVPR
jgi:hypothetical protein